MLSYEGLFFEGKDLEVIRSLESKPLDNINDEIHCTFKYHPLEDEVFNELVGKKFEIYIIGYGNDGKNSGFEIKLPKELEKYYINFDNEGNLKIPHITASLADGAKASNTKNLKFERFSTPVKVTGTFGFWIKENDKEYLSYDPFYEEYVRVSASYLYNIPVIDGNKENYLLVKSERRNQYQPIGGCYKYFSDSEKIFRKLGVISEKTSNGVSSVGDIRVLVPKRNIDMFLEWYMSKEGRENTFEREFVEEVVECLSEEERDYFSFMDCTLAKKGSFEEFFDEEKQISTIKPMDIVKVNLSKKQYESILRLADNDERFFNK